MNKKLVVYIACSLNAVTLFCQQAPLSENYFMDKYSLMPSYAGNFNAGYLATGYRSDWSGVKGGPKTLRITYNDVLPFMDKAGYGFKAIYDKAGIFSQLYLMGSYSYRLDINGQNQIMFGLSMGVYHNSINLIDYYNDPGYTIDPALINQKINSKIKFITDFSVLYKWEGLETGILFSNLTFGDASYKVVELKYTPLSNFQFHATYEYSVSEEWDIVPFMIIRAGKYTKGQFELASQAVYMKRVWASFVFRDPAILGIGIGGNLAKGISLGYNFNFSTQVVFGAFNNHEISLGVNLSEYLKK